MMNAKVIYILKSWSVLSDGEKGPILNYGNAAALKLWAASWEQLTSMPSSETAEPQERATRAAFMSQIKEKGFADNYSGKLHPSCEYWENSGDYFVLLSCYNSYKQFQKVLQ